MDHLIGTSLGRYRLDSLLGEGGMGAVFKAYDVTLQRDVAVKIMHPQFVRVGNFRERFLQEARTAARLNYPNIVQVHDFGQEKELLYIVMEFISGADLQQMLQDLRAHNQWISLAEGVELLRQVSLAIDYVHRQGVLHRDLKPANIMLKPEPSEELPYRPVVTDLGLAKLLEGEALTQEGTSMGTPSYMSPEQAMGEKVDARSDVYSLGILLYELSVGQLPFPIKSLTEAIRYHTKEPPPPPRTLRPDLPVLLEKIILKALEKDPNQRIPNAAELAKGLKSIAPHIAQATSSPTLLASSVSLVTQYQQSLLKPRGSSLIQEFAPPPDLSEDRIQILASDKTTTSVPFKRGGMLIGRDQHCDIVLDDTQASRSHARIEFDGVRYTVTDLGSTNGTFHENVKILPGIAEEWVPEKPIRIGSTYLRLIRADSQGSLAAQPVIPGIAAGRRSPARSDIATLDPAKLHASVIGGGRASLYLPESRFKIDPGGVAVIPLAILNQGNVVDHFRITADGFPPSWLQGQPPVVQLMPGGKQELSLSIQPPLSSRSRAGEYPITLRAISQDNPQDTAEAKAHLTVGAYTRFTSDLHPERIRAGAAARITVQNQGNRPENFNLTWRDRGEEVVFTPPSARITVPEGQSGTAEFTARPRQPKWSGLERVFPFSVQVAAEAGESQSHSGEVVARSRIPAWLVPVLLTLCFLLAGGAATASWIAYSNTANATATARAIVGLQTAAAQTVLADAELSKQAAQATQKAAEAAQATAFAATGIAEKTQEALSISLAATAKAEGDDDSDGLSNLQEAALGTQPNNPDTDADGLNDGAEVNQYGTNPKLMDTDGDTIPDGKEVTLGTSPLNKDTDGDGIQDNVDPDPVHLPTSTPPPPPDGVSMNCDNTYQRYYIEDKGAQGKVAHVNSWDGSRWNAAWTFAAGDPMERQIDATAGLYSFGTCTKMVVIPLIYSGSGAYLELTVFAWNGSTAISVLSLGGLSHGSWWSSERSLGVNYSIYLYNEPNCCACYTQSDRYYWDDTQFTFDNSEQIPTFSGDPPAECQAQVTLVPLNPIFIITPLPILPIFPINP